MAEKTSGRTRHVDPDIARSLNNQSLRLAKLGRCEVALAAIAEAVAIYRELHAAARPDAFRPNLAMSLTLLGIMLTELGDLDSRSVRRPGSHNNLRGALFDRPRAVRYALQQAVNNQEWTLRDLGHSEEESQQIDRLLSSWDD